MFKSLFRKPPVAPAVATPDTGLADQLILDGNRFEDAGQLERACELYRQAIVAAPLFAKAHLNLGIALAAAGNPVGAANAYEQVLRIEPDNAFGNYNFGRLTYLGRDLANAEVMLGQALLTKPDFFEALVLLSSVQEETGRIESASETLTKALQLRPDDSGAWVNQAVLLRKLDRPEDAEKAVTHALDIEPHKIEALWALSDILRSLGFDEEALLPLRKAMQIQPEKFGLQSAELFLMNFDERLSAEEIFQRHAAFGAKMEKTWPVRFARRRDTAIVGRRLRIGYVSGDFNSHPVSQFMLPVLERHDRSAFEIFCYSCGSRKDTVTEKIRSLCHGWTDANTMSDQQLADVISSNEIDILVDLSGHSGSTKLAVFSERPAALQATWLGYLNTSGLTRMDYRICDARTDPVDLAGALHTEKLLHLPESQWCYRPILAINPASTAPVQSNGHITFGSFNSGLKISKIMCRRWAEIMVAVPGSRLIIADVKLERKQAAIKRQMWQQGVSADRIRFMPRMDLPDYFALYNSVDISLDTHPYGGGTTTFDALWMGVPVVTAMGRTSVSRSAASILAALGLSEWIAPSVEDYVSTAIRHASDPAAVQRLRQSLRQLLVDSPLADEVRFTRGLEACYTNMWADFCAQEAIN